MAGRQKQQPTVAAEELDHRIRQSRMGGKEGGEVVDGRPERTVGDVSSWCSHAHGYKRGGAAAAGGCRQPTGGRGLGATAWWDRETGDHTPVKVTKRVHRAAETRAALAAGSGMAAAEVATGHRRRFFAAVVAVDALRARWGVGHMVCRPHLPLTRHLHQRPRRRPQPRRARRRPPPG